MTKVNLDKLQATKNGNLESVIAEFDMPNGSLISLGEAYSFGTPTSTGDYAREVVKAVLPDPTKEVLLVAVPEVKYERNALDELDVVTPVGKVARAYHLTVGDKYQAEQSLFKETPEQGQLIKADATNGGYEKDTSGDAKTSFIVERLTKFGWDRRDMALLRVLSV